MNKIRIAICGYGNLGKGVEKALKNSNDMQLVGIFTRRDPSKLKINSGTVVASVNDIINWKDKIDVVIMCGGSATDLPYQVPEMSKIFNTVDSFDTHAKIPEYYNSVNESSLSAKKTAIISGGWDPGMFSMIRVYANSILPTGNTYTFWGKGVSQGHSDAIRRIEGVKNAIQYTIPVEEVIKKVRNGENPELKTSDKHIRECYVVANDTADKKRIENEIKSMPNYFSDYHTIVHFISEDELIKNHSKMSHGGFVIHSTEIDNNKFIMEYSLKLDSNPEFTALVLIALARANYKMYQMGQYGAKTILDIPPAFLSEKTPEELRRDLL